MKINFDFKTNFELDVEVSVEGFTPSREAPACSDHDSLRYSDCGDDAEFDWFDCHFILFL